MSEIEEEISKIDADILAIQKDPGYLRLLTGQRSGIRDDQRLKAYTLRIQTLELRREKLKSQVGTVAPPQHRTRPAGGLQALGRTLRGTAQLPASAPPTKASEVAPPSSRPTWRLKPAIKNKNQEKPVGAETDETKEIEKEKLEIIFPPKAPRLIHPTPPPPPEVSEAKKFTLKPSPGPKPVIVQNSRTVRTPVEDIPQEDEEPRTSAYVYEEEEPQEEEEFVEYTFEDCDVPEYED